MNKRKILELVLGIMSKLKIQDKKIRYVVLAALGLIIAALTQLPDDMVAQVIQSVPEASSDSSGGILDSVLPLLKLVL